MPTADPSPAGKVAFEGGHDTLTYERRLAHPPEAVWEVLTDPAQVTQWYMLQATIDGREGGSVDFRGGPVRYHITGRILAWEPPRLLEYEWKIGPRPDMPAGEDAVVRWELRRDGQGTVLTLVHRKVTRATALGIGPAWHVLLDRLAAQLDGLPLPEMRQRFAEVQGHYHAQES